MFKKIVFLTFVFLFGLLSISYASSETIEFFNVKINIDSHTGFLEVTETIIYNFGTNQKHGIVREIPLTSKNGPTLDINILGVTDVEGNSYPYTTSLNDNILTIKIGDPNILVSGIKVYKINYLVKNAIRNFNDHQELYWNATGNDWLVPIKQSEVIIVLNKALSFPNMTCYTGPLGSQQKNCTFVASDASIKYSLTKSLSPKEGFTIVLGLPQNYINIITNTTIPPIKFSQSSQYSFLITRFLDITHIFLPVFLMLFISILISLIGLNIIKLIFKILGKAGITNDIFSSYNKPRPFIPKQLHGRPIIVEYEPPQGLLPIDVGTIFDQKVDPTDLSSVIINLAIRGYLKIKYFEEPALFGTKTQDFEFIRLKDGSDLVHPIDKWVFFLLFSTRDHIKLNDLSGDEGFMSLISKMKQDEKQYLIIKNYVKDSAIQRKNILSIILLILLLIIDLIIGKMTLFWLMIIWFIFIFSNVIIIAQPRLKLTSQGLEALEKILGFKEFLAVTEKERLDFFNAPELKPEKFEEYLPYAIVLGVEDKWAQKFDKIYITNPTWYDYPNMSLTTFNTYLLTQNLIILTSSLNTKLNISGYSSSFGGYSSGFSGGGSSGGGSGGGGGGSW